MSTFLVRKYVKNGDKSNKTVDSIELALKIIGKDFKDIYTEVFSGVYVDLYFIGTEDYIRVNNSGKKEFKVTYDHSVYKPSSNELLKSQQIWSLYLSASDLESAKEKLRTDYNKNPSYFKIVQT
jgi:hypothetical protein